MRVIGICGTNGSGKGVTVEILKKYFDCIHVSAREMIIQIAKQEGINMVNRDDLREFNEKRNREGKSLVSDLKKTYDLEENKNKYVIFESIRRVGEINELKEKFQDNFILISVDTPIELRYERIKSRNSLSDHIPFEVFVEHERLENQSDDPNQMNLKKCIELSEIKLQNTSSIENLEIEIKEKVFKNPFFQ